VGVGRSMGVSVCVCVVCDCWKVYEHMLVCAVCSDPPVCCAVIPHVVLTAQHMLDSLSPSRCVYSIHVDMSHARTYGRSSLTLTRSTKASMTCTCLMQLANRAESLRTPRMVQSWGEGFTTIYLLRPLHLQRRKDGGEIKQGTEEEGWRRDRTEIKQTTFLSSITLWLLNRSHANGKRLRDT
jgi:hypothetical protein